MEINPIMNKDQELIEEVAKLMFLASTSSMRLDAAQKIIAIIDKARSGWISVEDRLPENDARVDVWFTTNDCDERLTDYFYKKDTNQWWRWGSEYGGSSYKQVLPLGVTHWRKRPPPPEQRGE